MDLFFRKFDSERCCLCGGSPSLTREHKIKASALRREFGRERLIVRQTDIAVPRTRHAQSTDSKYLKFAARICEACNTKRTQAADRAFDRFHKATGELLQQGKDLAKVFESAALAEGTNEYLDVFRYFAKILCCHLAEIEAPIPIRLSGFAIGENPVNCIWLAVQHDRTYAEWAIHSGDHAYAAHGGLIVYGDKVSGDANAFHSTISIGGVQYVFHLRLLTLEKLAIRFAHPRFFQWCRNQVEAAKLRPMSDEDKSSHGLIT